MASLNLKIGPPLSAVNGLPGELELHGDHGARLLLVRLEARLAVTRDLADLRIRKDAGVVARGLLGLAGKPQAGGDFLAELHGVTPVSVVHLLSRTGRGRIDTLESYFGRRRPAIGRRRRVYV